jgi:hypothetical protein
MTKLENGQLEIDVPDGDGARAASRAAEPSEGRPREERPRGRGREERGRGRRGGRGRDREREPRSEEPRVETPPVAAAAVETAAPTATEERRPETVDIARDGIGTGGERLTRDEAFDLVRRAVDILTGGADTPVLASDVRRKARDLLGRDSESLNERMFVRVLRDAHDANVVDLRKRGDDWELAPAADVAPIADQLQAAVPTPSQSQAGRSAATAASFRRGMRSRGGRTSGAMELPPELLSLGVVDFGAPAVPDETIEREPVAVDALGAGSPAESIVPEAIPDEPAQKPRRPARGRKTAKKGKAEATAAPAGAEGASPAKAKRHRPSRGRAKKPAATGGEG